MTGLKFPDHRETLDLPVGFKEPGTDDVVKTAEVRAVTGGDEFYIGMSPEYRRSPNDLVYKTMLLARCVTKLGDQTTVSVSDINKLHAADVRVLEYAIYGLTYGADSLPQEDPESPGG
jgi:hypothetical protein